MKKIFKKITALFCAAVMLAAILPYSALAAGKNGNYKLIALTFDDGPGRYTSQLLDGLKERNVPATFFVLGSNAKSYPDLLKRMVKEGHQLASHTYSHAQLTTLSSSGIKSEINNTRNLLAAAGGDQTYYIRPPYGSYNSTVKSCAGAPLILWSVDPEDWKYRNTTTVTNNIMNAVQDGDIILLHDIYSTSVNAALNVIDKLKAKGYEFVTVSELLRRRGITPENGGVYYRAKNNGINLGPKVPWDETAYDESKLSSHWAYSAISFALDNGIMTRNSDGAFAPNKYITRGDFAAALAKLYIYSGGALNEPEMESIKFKDVSETSAYADYVKWTAASGIMAGYGNGIFGINDFLTREQMAICVERYLKYCGCETDYGADFTLKYNDASSIASWAVSGVKYCSAAGLLKGDNDGNFTPKKNTTRAQAATTAMRLFESSADIMSPSESEDIEPTYTEDIPV